MRTFLLVLLVTVAIGVLLTNEPAVGIVGLIILYLYVNNETDDGLNEEIAKKLKDIGSPTIIDDEPSLILLLWDMNEITKDESPLVFETIVSKCQEFLVADQKLKHIIKKEIKQETDNLGFMAYNESLRKSLSKLVKELDQHLPVVCK
jgi:hypothetical protein